MLELRALGWRRMRWSAAKRLQAAKQRLDRSGASFLCIQGLGASVWRFEARGAQICEASAFKSAPGSNNWPKCVNLIIVFFRIFQLKRFNNKYALIYLGLFG